MNPPEPVGIVTACTAATAVAPGAVAPEEENTE
jgi:hypothetical protein